MPRYIVFKGSDYYPNGGWDDIECDSHGETITFDTISAALEVAEAESYKWTWAEIVDLDQLKVVRRLHGN